MYSVQQTNDGGYVVAGTTDRYNWGPPQIYLIKTNSNGDTLWTKSYGSAQEAYGYSVKQTLDSGFIIAGAIDSFSSGGFDAFLIKTNSLGDTLWTKTYGGINNDGARSVELTTDGGYIITGNTSSFGAGYNDVYLIKTDSTGDTLWTKAYGTITNDEGGNSVKQTTDGGFIIAGSIDGAYIYLIKTNSIGDTLWTKTYGGDGAYDPAASSVQQTTDGGYIITGTADNWIDNSLTEAFLMKTNSTGDALWTKVYYYGYNEGHFVQQTTDGGYIVSGWSLIKTDSNGNSGCYQANFPSPIYSFPTQISNTATIVKSGCIVSNPSKPVGRGGMTVTTECFSTGINEIKEQSVISLYPNPANTILNIHSQHPLLNSQLIITDVLGRELYQETLTGIDNSISIATWSAGVYFYEIRGSGLQIPTSKRGKFVKE